MGYIVIPMLAMIEISMILILGIGIIPAITGIFTLTSLIRTAKTVLSIISPFATQITPLIIGIPIIFPNALTIALSLQAIVIPELQKLNHFILARKLKTKYLATPMLSMLAIGTLFQQLQLVQKRIQEPAIHMTPKTLFALKVGSSHQN